VFRAYCGGAASASRVREKEAIHDIAPLARVTGETGPPAEAGIARGRLTRSQLLRAAGSGAGLYVVAGIAPVRGGLVERALAVPSKQSAARVQTFRTRPDLSPPVIEILHAGRGAAPGYVFIAPSSGPGQRGVMMFDDAGDLVWFHPTVPQTAMNFRAQSFRGKPVLTWWEGKSHKGVGVGACVIVDQSYREIARFRAGHRRPADLHEFLLTPRGTALVMSTETRTLDLRRLGGRRRWPVVGTVVQELAVPSARVLFDWRSLDHVALEESHAQIGPHFDYFHGNSIAVDADGHLLISARNTWAVYKVHRRTGRVLWRLGGKKSDFVMGKGTFFAWQHDARSHDGGSLLTIFDDGAAPAVEKQSRGLLIALDQKRRHARLIRAYTHRPSLLAKYTGSVQLLGNGDVLVGWGSEPYFTEFTHDGAVRWDAKLPHGGQTYRALRFPWEGRPTTDPSLVVSRTSGSTVLYASWNGATEVSAWQLLVGTSPSTLEPAATVPRQGFETRLMSEATTGSAAVVALDGRGAALGRSATMQF
jgi:hypothetical protein